ncbi:hypothetical protein NDU88_009473 [Pleurodeles waltl]|uniref:Uncharacterized protein n=1 Tax=Pleurodeles waltl TaxID=8319 RepID=A0AAV7PSV8_PLEWA|nr:hypothetical protein NDU88_009473 [Pleurodeles waltl]
MLEARHRRSCRRTVGGAQASAKAFSSRRRKKPDWEQGLGASPEQPRGNRTSVTSVTSVTVAYVTEALDNAGNTEAPRIRGMPQGD